MNLFINGSGYGSGDGCGYGSGYTCDGPKESAHLHIDGLRGLFA